MRAVEHGDDFLVREVDDGRPSAMHHLPELFELVLALDAVVLALGYGARVASLVEHGECGCTRSCRRAGRRKIQPRAKKDGGRACDADDKDISHIRSIASIY